MSIPNKLPSSPRCPNCQGMLDGFSSVGDAHTPREGDVTVCAYCREVLQFTDGLGLRRADPDAIEEVMLEVSKTQNILNLFDKIKAYPILNVGDLVFTQTELPFLDGPSKGYVYDVYELGGRPGYGIIFQNGFHDGFSPQEIVQCGVKPVGITDSVRYEFTNVIKLDDDFKQGRFGQFLR